MTGDDVLRDWADALRRSVPTAAKAIKKMRAHVLKIDVEGHDYDVRSVQYLTFLVHSELVCMHVDFARC